ncbi:MAG TPA: hypothetical protein VHW09_31200 [Bryobacteraceae bacterium]|nr:hypothetical protein [Bryobacteraceae bacterium]
MHPNLSIASPAAPDDPTDPYVVAEAATLNHDPNQIYAFVRDQIKTEAYPLALRGARGALWAMAGNTVDKAILLSALLKASGYTTQYMHTYPNQSQAATVSVQNMLRGMFANTPVLLGCVPINTATDDPAGNGAFYWLNDYFWVEYGPQNIDLDPNIAGGQPGQTIATPDTTYATVPAAEMEPVTIKINAETFSQASGLFGFGPSTATVLTQQFYSWQLVGNIISAGNIVQTTAIGGLDFSATTFTYTPYLLIGSGGPDVSQDTILTGTDYQEVYSSYPLSSQILTGLFVEVDAYNAFQANQQVTYTHTLFDRLGPAARSGNATAQITTPSSPSPAVSAWDIATMNILPTRLNLNTFQAAQTRLNNAYQAYLAIKPAFNALPSSGTLTAAQQLVAQQAVTLSKYLLITSNEMSTMAYDGAADRLAGQLDTGYFVKVYPSSPRITIVNSSLDSTGNAIYTMDVLKNDMYVIDGYGQNRNVVRYEEVARGMIESTMEAAILSAVTGATNAYDIGTVMVALGDPNQLIGAGPAFNYNGPNSLALLSSTGLSADAQTLITSAVLNGDQVIAPNQMVTINGTQTVGWWEMDQNGHTVSHFPNGNHQAIAEYGGVNEFAQAYNKPIAKFIGQVEGVGITAFAFAGAVIESVAENASFAGLLKNVKTDVGGVETSGATDPLKDFFENFNKIMKQLHLPEADELGTSLLDEFAEGLQEGVEKAQEWLEANLPEDPEVSTFLTTPLGTVPAMVTPGSTPGVTITTSLDNIYTIPFNGNELPVYDVFITNTGPNTDTFNLNPIDTSSHWRLYTSVTPLTLLAGQTGEVNLCAVPYDPSGVAVPPLGATGNYQITATSPGSGATGQVSPAYTVGAIPTVAMSVDPQVITVAPGQTTMANLIITSVGNADAGTVTLTAVADPAITVGGLTSPVTLTLNSAITQQLSFTAAANAVHNVYNVVVTASYTASGSTQSVSFTIPVTVQQLGTCSLNAALAANQTGASSLGTGLTQLANDMNAAAAAPANPVFESRIGADVTIITGALGLISYLLPFDAPVTAAGAAVATATPGNLFAALSNLDAAICPVGTALNQASSYNTQISLAPNSLVAAPNAAAVFTVNLYNPSPTTKVYNLTVTGVPSGVTALFDSTTVNLGPVGQYSAYSSSYGLVPVTLTLTPGASFTAPVTFTVTATPVGAPEFAVSTSGTLLVRPQQISIDNITATPAYGPPGTQFVITARVFAEVNEVESSFLTMQPYTASGSAITFGYQSPTFNLSPDSTLQTVTIATIDSTNFANGPYTVQIQGYNTNPYQAFPGATGAGSFLVGAPLSGTLTANANSTPPGSVAPGNSAAQVSLNIARDAVPNPVSTLVGTTVMTGVPHAMTLFQNGGQQLAYVCSDSVVNIVDVTDPSNMQVLGTFAGDILTTETGAPGDPTGGVVPGFQVMACSTYNSAGSNNFVISYSRFDGNTTAQPIPTHFATYSLAHPTAPTLVGGVVDIARADSTGLYVAGTTALMYQSTTFYNPYSNFIFAFTGDIWAAGLGGGAVTYDNDVFSCGGLNASSQCNNGVTVPTYSNNGGVCTSTGTTVIANDQTRGGPYRIGLGTAVNSTTTYFASSNSVEGNIENPACPTVVGQLLVVDTTNPMSPQVVTSVADPAMAFMSGVAVQGHLAVAVGDSTGIYDINSGYVGTLVISSFDISNPQNPTLTSSITTQLQDSAGSFIIPLGSNTFAVGNTTLNKNAELVLVDATDPSNLRYIPYNANFVANPTIAENGFFFALSATPASSTNSLSAFQLSEITGPQLTVKLNLPTTGNAVIDPTSFSLAPSKVTTGTTYNTYEWDQPAPNTISFNVNLTGINPGDVPVVVTGGEMDYTLPALGPGTFVLPTLTVLCQHILDMTPVSQYVQNAGNSATYMVTVSNPTSVSQTFVPYTAGIPSSWGVQQPASVTVPAGGSQSFNLVLTTATGTTPATYTFFAAVATAGGINSWVGGTIIVQNVANSTNGNVGTGYVAFTASISPSQVTIGPYGAVQFQVAITNTGTVPATIYVSYPSGYSLPSGWQIPFTPTYGPYVQPGPGNTAYITGTLQVPPSYFNTTAPGTYVIPLQVVQAYNVPTVNIPLTVNIVAAGFTTLVNPGSGPPTGSYSLHLANTGNASDSYNISLQGQLAQVATIPSPQGPIAAGATTDIPIAINPINFVAPGNYTLQVKTVSQSNPALVSYSELVITVPSAAGVSAAINPSPTSVASTPDSVSLLFQANNTGNTKDTYTASITNTAGAVSATLNGGQTISAFAVPGLGNAIFPLNATVSGSGNATVTVTVQSLTTPTEKASATVVINGPPAANLPTANAGSGGNVPAHRLTLLNGTASADTNTPPLPLSYAWSLISAPAGSALTTSSIGLPTASLATFRPDVLGAYRFELTVSTTNGSSSALVTYTAADSPPVAVTGFNFNARVGTFAFLNGNNSYDPDSQPISFAWSLISAPQGSAVTSTSIFNSQTTNAFFTSDVAGAYQFQLVVTDASASSPPALVTVTAFADGSAPPDAVPGPVGQNIGINGTATVIGTSSYDPNSTPIGIDYRWSLTSSPNGSAATLSRTSTSFTTVTPDLPGTYVVTLMASNSHGSNSNSVTITAYSSDVPPNASAGPSQFVTPTSVVNLSAQATADPDSGPLNLAFLWWLDSLPYGSTSTIQNATNATPTFTADKPGYYLARVEANDGLLAGFANALVTSAQLCDADANGVINSVDIALIQAAIGQTAAAGDPRDSDANGTIAASDVTGCSGMVSTGTPVFQVLPASVTQTVIAGSPAVSHLVQVASTGDPITFTVQSTQPWVTPSVTTDSTGSISTLSATLNPASLTASATPYTATLTFTPSVGAAIAIPVSLTVMMPGVEISPMSFTENLVQGAAAVTQQLQISSSGSAVSFTVVSDAAWLTSSIGSGNTATVTSLNAIVNPGSMTPGSYTGHLTFTPGGQVTVTLTVTAPGPVSPSPMTLTFNANYGGPVTAAQPVNVTSTSGAVNFSVTSDSSWLSAAMTTGTTPQTLNVTATPGTLSPGTYNGNLTLISGSNTSMVSVTFNIAGVAGSPCDVNQDGHINIVDVQKMVNEALGLAGAGNDLTSDGILNLVDVQIDVNAALNLGCSAH